jgi:hypothetical protein
MGSQRLSVAPVFEPPYPSPRVVSAPGSTTDLKSVTVAAGEIRSGWAHRSFAYQRESSNMRSSQEIRLKLSDMAARSGEAQSLSPNSGTSTPARYKDALQGAITTFRPGFSTVKSIEHPGPGSLNTTTQNQLLGDSPSSFEQLGAKNPPVTSQGDFTSASHTYAHRKAPDGTITKIRGGRIKVKTRCVS